MKTLSYSSRAEFFQRHPNIHTLLQTNSLNPLLEEGRYTSENNRDRDGEYFITSQVLRILVQQKIFEQSKVDPRYDINNVFIFETEYALKEALKNLYLENGEDFKIIYIVGIHAIPIYIQKNKNKYQVLFLDSEGTENGDRELLSLFSDNLLADIELFVNKRRLQKDYFSCTIFAFKALRYFVKHGKQIFTEITSVKNGSYFSIGDGLPVCFLKMAQTFAKSTLSAEALTTVVSVKKGMTLDAYLTEHGFFSGNRQYNSAAIEKGYEYLHIVEKTISSPSENVCEEESKGTHGCG